MSKKKKKLDKKLIEERLRELEAEARESKGPLVPKKEAVETPKDFRATGKKPQIKTAVQEPQRKKLSDSDEIIVRDVKKVVILTTVIIVIFIALYFVNLKTNYILKASDKIFNILHVGQL
jgi:hypothetical protein